MVVMASLMIVGTTMILVAVTVIVAVMMVVTARITGHDVHAMMVAILRRKPMQTVPQQRNPAVNREQRNRQELEGGGFHGTAQSELAEIESVPPPPQPLILGLEASTDKRNLMMHQRYHRFLTCLRRHPGPVVRPKRRHRQAGPVV